MTQARTVSASFTPTPTPTPTPTITWKTVAQEFGSFTLPASTLTRYGAQSKWVERTLTGTVYCNNSTFGDPIPNIAKSCQIPSTANTITPLPTPTPPTTPTVSTYTLTTAVSGQGTITATNINCGTDCSESYTSGTTITLTATPSTGYTFAGWSGACTGTGTCSVSMTQARTVTATFTATVVTTPPPTSMGFMPYVDKSKNVTPAVGYSTLRVKPTTEIAPASTIGAFRTVCTPSHMNNDDPLVYPGQPGVAHHHTFYGNTSVTAMSDTSNFANVGNSTCRGGTMNRSAYWVPSMINTTTNAPMLPDTTTFYYKRGYTVPATVELQAPPPGLRMLAGNPKATTISEGGARYTCLELGTNSGWTKNIPDCSGGNQRSMEMSVGFPQCWDGVNLDSADHKSHMAYPSRKNTTANKCPITHPIALPEVTVNLNFDVTAPGQTAVWRLSSDNYDSSQTGGLSGHADWINGWNDTFIKDFVKNCLNGLKDGHAHLLCDGRTFY